MTKITVIDAIMGAGKSSYITHLIHKAPHDQSFLYITPLLSECHRVACTTSTRSKGEPPKRDSNNNIIYTETTNPNAVDIRYRKFKHPEVKSSGGKIDSLKYLVEHKHNITSTHSLLLRLEAQKTELFNLKDYILIVDEALNAYSEYDQLSAYTVKQQIKNGLFSIDPDGFTLLFHPEVIGTTGSIEGLTQLEEYAELCNRRVLLFVGGKIIVWELSPDLLNSFKEVWFCTYQYKGTVLDTYLISNGFQVQITTIPTNKKPSDYKPLITIIEEDKLNAIGAEKYSLSYTAMEEVETLEVLRKNLMNFFITKCCNATAKDRIWTSYKEKRDVNNRIIIVNKVIAGKNYFKQWLPFNTKATNEYSNCHNVAYLCNIFLNVDIKTVASKKGHPVDEDMHALNEMIQFIWRSAIRNQESINLYIPSARMRNLFKSWLNDEFEIKEL
jgi:hypothetical protein